MKRKKTTFSHIHTLEDIRNDRQRLKTRLNEAENILSAKTDLVNLLFCQGEKSGGFFGKKDLKTEILEYLLPLGFNYARKLFKNYSAKKSHQKILIYAAFGSVAALLVYKFLKSRKTKA